MNAGKLDQRITIQVSGTTQDANGEPVAGWTDVVADCPASVTDMSGREYVAANAPQNSAQTKITIRYREGIKPAMRVLHRSIPYGIESVLGKDLKWLLLMCKRAD